MSNDITRQELAGLISKQLMKEVVESAVADSAVLKYFRRLPDMTSNQTQMTVLDNLPIAYWQTSNTSMKKLTKLAWKNKYIIAEELAVIVPIAENLVRDADVDLFEIIKPRLAEAFRRKIDEAILTGVDKPEHFRMSLIDSAINAGATVTETNSFYSDINNAMAFVEESGYEPNVAVGSLALKAKFRKLVDSTGQPILGTEISELPRVYVNNGAWDKKKAVMLVGDLSQAVYAIRQDITFKVFDTGVISDPVTGEQLYNLMQQDMLAIRAVMRLGWQVPNPVNAINDDNSTRFPFSVVVPSDAPTTYDLTFTVTDDSETPKAIEGAKVNFSGLEKVTDANGKAVFKCPANTKGIYEIKAEGKQTNKGRVEVESANKTVSVILLGE